MDDRDHRSVCFELLYKEEVSIDAQVDDIWYQLCCYLPAGLDYFVLDTAVVCGLLPAKRWVEHLYRPRDEPENRLIDRTTGDTPWEFFSRNPESFVLALELLRRRRLHLDPSWAARSEVLTNRTNRVTARALKLIIEEKERTCSVASQSQPLLSSA